MGTPAGRGKRGRKAGPGGRAPATDPAPPPAASDAEAGFVFPADAEPVDQRRAPITLPPSGLAADILALAGAAAVPAALPSRPEPAPTIVAEVAPRAHNISFFAAPVREERKAAEATEHLATFFLGREEYGVDVRLVQEIIRVAEITQVPRAPDFIKGVINLRGRIIPVVDLKKKLGLGEVEIARPSRIVVVKIKERLIGLLVDGASQVLKVPVSTIEAAPDEVTEIDATAIRGVAKLPGRLIILMDLTKTLSLELKEQADEAAGSN
jgi:purine-binding chemotaxis protein CheW